MLKHKLQPYLAQLKSRQITNREVAAELGVSEHHLCRVLKTLNLQKDMPTAKANAELKAARKAHRLNVAKALPIKEAAKAANCSTRTIYRLRNT